MASEETIKHLWDCSNVLASESHTTKLLKSYYMSTCRKMTFGQVKCPQQKFRVSQMCPRCCCSWNANDFELSLRPQCVTNTEKVKRLISKLEESKLTKQKGLLTKKQRRRAKWLQKHVTNNVEIYCHFCDKRSIVPLEEPKQVTPAIEVLPDITQTVVSKKSKKKKNRNKDKNAGLILPKELKQPKKTKIKLEKPQSSEACIENKSVPIKKATNQLNNTQSVNETKINKQTKLSQSLKAKKQQKGKTNPSAKAKVQTIKSKTQQNNSLLQLAALLKSQATKSNSNSTQNRLQSLLK